MNQKIIAIIGGGPNSVYATEIILKKLLKNKIKKKIKIIFFDKDGNFGYGNTHNTSLDKNILLNRIAHQISLGVFPYLKFPKKLKKFDYNFMDWVKKNKIKNIKNESWPSRYLFGQALKEKFYELIDIFQKNTNVEIEFIYGQVINIKKNQNYYEVKTNNKNSLVTDILICAGNYHSSSVNSRLGNKINKLTENTDCKFYYNFLELLPKNTFWEKIKKQNIAVYGTGVSSIDIITKLIKNDNKIYSISKSSLFPFARPFNQKIDDPKNKEHKPIFLNNKNINYLKSEVNNIKNLKKLDFEKFIYPLIKIEFYYVYFKFFIKKKEILNLKKILLIELSKLKKEKKYNFLKLVGLFDEFINYSIKSKKIKRKFFKEEWFGKQNILNDIKLKKYNFYDVFVNPLIYSEEKKFKDEYLKFLKWDLKQSKIGNMKSPYKNACDGVWRDIRPQYTKLFDNCSNLIIFNYFIKNILSVHNKLCDGPSSESIHKIKKLIKENKIKLIKAKKFTTYVVKKKLYIKHKNKKTNLNYIFYGILDLYKKNYVKDKMISSMIKNKLVSMNDLKHNNKKYKIGLKLNINQNPIVKNKTINNIRFVGPSAEGKKFFHHTLSRPDKKQFNIYDLIDWSNKLFNY